MCVLGPMTINLFGRFVKDLPAKSIKKIKNQNCGTGASCDAWRRRVPVRVVLARLEAVLFERATPWPRAIELRRRPRLRLGRLLLWRAVAGVRVGIGYLLALASH